MSKRTLKLSVTIECDTHDDGVVLDIEETLSDIEARLKEVWFPHGGTVEAVSLIT